MKLVGAVALAALAALAACADPAPNPAPNSVHGTVGGQTLQIAEAVWTVATPSNLPPDWSGQAAFVVMSTEPGLCNRAASNTVLPGETILTFEMVDIAGMSTTAPSAPGSYTVPIESSWAAQTAWLRTTSVDAHCVLSGTGDARSGTVEIGSIAGSTFTGSFDVGLDLGGELTGTFSAASCAGLDQALQFTPPSCQP